ncbi:hypothetical protein E1B28_012567 [Marasmius oreades]|uniref:Cep57 centrosome microtubule-binding domain-containing protein n=1 Tax=Marasmius oreades TaxID=181124 RepID=A0A9P7UND9_9AGAR|nr:uncharacterized protein E1B28_012567 [Marasmius oreades]KAG7088592.1 hypothetical protein E1B28_012567 [Marasmius oreades]
MKNTSRPPVIRIQGDQIESDRIQLEHNLQNTDLSIRLSSQDDFDDSIEYPRHNSGPSPFNDFGSFIHRSGDHFDGDIPNAWSYRTGDDEEGVHPYGGETMSTAAHHASALTLNAGLGGNRGARREVSLSGAEYDPDRPLHAMIAGVDSKLSIFDADPSRSKYTAPGGITFDPLVVDSTAELDRILKSGHAPPPSLRCRADVARSNNSSSTSSSSDSEGPNSRPKITDALRRVSFSPKRPRSPKTYHSPHHRSSNLPDVQPTPSILLHTSPLSRQPHFQTTDGHTQSTPKPRTTKRTNILPTHSSQPEVRLQPPTPSSSTSRFNKQARGLSKDIDTEAERSRTNHKRNDMPEGFGIPGSTKHFNTNRNNSSKSRIHLPDVTGLTNAVESPAKVMLNHYSYQPTDEPRENEARLLAVLNTIQSKLSRLEDENSISRRRVRELEYELEVCKREVAKERTRVLEKESAILQNQRELERAVADAKKSMKGKGKARDASINNDADASVRYKEAVEEKKALEALISTLRSHLTRLTAELSSHQELLVELRSLREADSRALREKAADITQLRNEVERLAGEVEVLRGVVEEGLKERRLNRENSKLNESQSQSGSQVVDIADTRTSEGGSATGEAHEEEEEEEADDEDDQEETGEPEPFDPQSIPGSSRDGLPDRTMGTDRATVGVSSSGVSNQSRSGRFIDDEELVRIAADVEERRSELSVDSPSDFTSRILEPSCSASQSNRRSVLEVEEVMDDRAASPTHSLQSEGRPDHSTYQPQPVESRPAAPTPAHASWHNKRLMRRTETDYHDADDSISGAPFPQIRGERLERLFFSAPDHDEKTCNVCHRKRGNVVNHRPTSPSLLPGRLGQGLNKRMARETNDEEDEGFAEEEDVEIAESPRREKRAEGRGRVPAFRDSYEKRKNLPQQTVLVRVIRELEDDFTHFKGVYVELADQYKDMDPISDVLKRNLLAQHLREVIDILEQKGDQIASLYDLLTFQDKPTSNPQYTRSIPKSTNSLGRTAGVKNRLAFA